jgi:hypothetical protein
MQLNLIKTAWAATIPTNFPNEPLVPSQYRSIGGILGAILNVVFYVGIAMSIIFLIIGGIKYITAGGDETKVAAARGQVTNAIIGFVIVIAAFTVRYIVQNLIGVQLPSNEVLPGF